MSAYTWSVVGHTTVKKYVDDRLAANTFPQAVLCIGPEAVGKRMLVRELANRLGATGLSILECDCATASVQELRAFVEQCSLRPVAGSAQVALFDHAEALSTVMANALLKTLEEPPAHTFFFLISSQPNVLPTIASRCTQLRFGVLGAEECAAIVGSAWQPALASVYARLGPGIFVRDAGLAERIGAWLVEWQELTSGSQARRLLLAQRLSAEETAVLQQKIRVWLAHASASAVEGEYARRLTVLQEALRRLAGNANRKLVAEYLSLHI